MGFWRENFVVHSSFLDDEAVGIVLIVMGLILFIFTIVFISFVVRSRKRMKTLQQYMDDTQRAHEVSTSAENKTDEPAEEESKSSENKNDP